MMPDESLKEYPYYNWLQKTENTNQIKQVIEKFVYRRKRTIDNIWKDWN